MKFIRMFRGIPHTVNGKRDNNNQSSPLLPLHDFFAPLLFLFLFSIVPFPLLAHNKTFLFWMPKKFRSVRCELVLKMIADIFIDDVRINEPLQMTLQMISIFRERRSEFIREHLFPGVGLLICKFLNECVFYFSTEHRCRHRSNLELPMRSECYPSMILWCSYS